MKIRRIGIIRRSTSFQDWWKDRVGDRVEIIGEYGNSWITNERNEYVNLQIPKYCVEIAEEHPDLSELSDEVLLAECKRRGLIND